MTDEPAWSVGILAHLEYMWKTPASYDTGLYRSAHIENPASPFYTEAGAKEGESSALGGGHTNVEAIDNWLGAPFHGLGMLRPALRQVAFARNPVTGDAGLDEFSGLESYGPPSQQVLFPGPGSTIDLVRYIPESPSPIGTCEAEHPGADYRYPGLPAMALLTEPPSPELAATLTMPNGKTLSSSGPELCVITEHNFVTNDPIYGPAGRGILFGDQAVFVIPREPLVEGTYSIDLAQPGRHDITWSFRSQPKSEVISRKFGLTIRAQGSTARVSPVGLGTQLLGRQITVTVTRWWVPCALVAGAKRCTWVQKGRAQRKRLRLSRETVVRFRRAGPWEKVAISVEAPQMVVGYETFPPSSASALLKGPKPHHVAR